MIVPSPAVINFLKKVKEDEEKKNEDERPQLHIEETEEREGDEQE